MDALDRGSGGRRLRFPQGSVTTRWAPVGTGLYRELLRRASESSRGEPAPTESPDCAALPVGAGLSRDLFFRRRAP